MEIAETEPAAGQAEAAEGPGRGRWLHLGNLAASWSCQLIGIAGSFIVTPALIFGLGEAQYGAWLLVNSFITHLRALDLGMSAGTLRFTAGALARGDQTRLRQIHSSSAMMFAGAASLALLATGILSVLLPRLFPEALAGKGGVIAVLGLAGLLDLLLHPQPASLRARSFYFIPDSVEFLTYTVFKLGLVLWLSRTGISLWLLALLVLAESLVRNLAMTGSALWLCPWTRRPSPRAVDRATVWALAVYGTGTFLIQIGELVRFQLDSAVIGYFLTSEHITVYSIGMRLIHIAYMAIAVIGAMTFPRFAGLHERHDRQGIERLLDKANLTTGLVTGWVLANIAVLGLPFLRLWIRKPWVEEAFLVTQIMLPAYFVALLTIAGEKLLMASGRLRGITALTLAEAAANLGLSIALIGRYGIYGVCLGTAIPMLVFRGILFPFLLRAEAGISLGQWARSHRRSVPLALGYIALLLPLRLLRIEGPVAFVAAGLATSAVFAALVLVAVPEARDELRALLGSRGLPKA
ncbi:MAG: oligosaccharide flippase family protein [Deltaproteobacteria bacterium]|nr:oligosaccharide flippase family protein [Deltaproteobacteria bacterium]